MLEDARVEIVYVGNVHSHRRSIGEKCLLANKHVLLEKPFACNAKDAQYLITLAKERHLFIMEGMWTRFFPAVELSRRLVLGNGQDQPGVIGDVVSVVSDFNFNASDSDEYPSSILYNHKEGGGASLFIAPYPLAAALLFFNGTKPEKVFAVGQVDRNTGVDLQASMSLSFPPTSNIVPDMKQSVSKDYIKLPGCGVASLNFGMLGESPEETTVVGTKGRLIIRSPCHCPTHITCSIKNIGRGHTRDVLEYSFPIPEETEEIKKSGGCNYPNSLGFAYEQAAVARCIAKGLMEAPQYTHKETLITMELIDELRSQLGVQPLS